MRTHRTYISGLLLAAGLLAYPGNTAAQTPRATRADAAAHIGWLYLDTRVGRSGDQARWDGDLYGGVSAGWYWTENLKTEIEAGGAGEAHGYGNELVVRDGRILSRFRHTTTQRNTVAISQQYQFGRNAWFHPHVALGGAIAFDTRTEYYEAIFDYFDPNRPPGVPVEPARVDGPERVTTFRPFVAVGFKTYVTRRAFMRSDLRVAGTTGRGVDEVQLRVGFGIDF